MTLEKFLYCFDDTITVHSVEDLKNIYRKKNQYEKEFLSKISKELKKEYHDISYKHSFKMLTSSDFIKVLAFGIKIGIELKDEFEKS